MHSGTRPFKRIELTLAALLRGCGFHTAWVDERVGGWVKLLPTGQAGKIRIKKADKKTVKLQEKVSMCVFVRGEMV